MARKKKIVEETITTVAQPTEEIVEIKLEENFMNPPEEEIIPEIKEPVKEEKEEKELRKVLQFTPVGPKIKYI